VPTPIEARPGRGFAPLTRPGSLAVTRGADGIEVLVCDNAAHTLTRHLLHQEPDGFAVTANDVVVRKWLAVPDGVAVSPDGRWLAVSNHRRHVVMVYERTRVVDERSDPSCILRGALFPHGVRFSADGRYLFVADAGSPYVHAYARDGDGWQGVAYPVASLRVMGDETFRQGRYSPDEGGPKGIDIDASGEVVAVSSRFRPLAFFGIAALLERTDRSGPDHAARLACALGLLVEAGARDRAQQQRFAWFTRSGVGRATRPLRRRLYARWPGLRPRRG
jgi:hypothetical protein